MVWTSLRRTSLRRTAQNFALSFPSPAPIFALFCLSHCLSSRGILVVFLKAGALKCARLGSRGVVSPAALGPPGLHTTTRELQTRTYERPGLQKHHQNSTRRPQRETKKSENGGGRRKKSATFCLPPFGAPPFGAPQ